MAPPRQPQRTIDVCIATYRRPALLGRLLDALAAQQVPAGWRMRIVVVDNDVQCSAELVVRSWRDRHRIDAVYDVEPEQNIALARNRAIALTEGCRIAFLDDDETPAPGWLEAILACMEQHRADVVFGPVESELPPHAPRWVRRCFAKPELATGTPVTHGGAGNVAFRRSVLKGRNDPFDPSFGRTGGEDTDWFYRLHLAGKKMIWCAEAKASELVPASRMQLSWVRRRAFRGGQTYYRVVVRRYPPGKLALWFAAKSAQLLGALVAAPVLLLASRPAYVALTLRGAGAAGQLARFLAARDMEEYRGSAQH